MRIVEISFGFFSQFRVQLTWVSCLSTLASRKKVISAEKLKTRLPRLPWRLAAGLTKWRDKRRGRAFFLKAAKIPGAREGRISERGALDSHGNSIGRCRYSLVLTKATGV